MDTLELISKLKLILSTSEDKANQFVKSSSLPIDDRFVASRTLECSHLRVQLLQFVSDLEALD